ncbi:MAG: hypothetical protein MI751_16945 [Pseudomonadales bacterium]|nr:hypothetical protein [Pseudomonadales bacterium]
MVAKPVRVSILVFAFIFTIYRPVEAETGSSCSESFNSQNYAAAQEICSKAAAAGDAVAQYLMAKGYLIGAFGQRDLDKAIEQARSCEDTNTADCANVLGLALRSQAIPADLQNPMSMHVFRSEVRYKADEALLDQANDALLRAAKAGSAKAMYNVGDHYLKGIWYNFEVNPNKAIEWGKKASAAGFVLGNLLQADAIITGEFEDNYSELTSLLRPAVKMDSRASYLLARVYELGLGVPRDLTTSYAWLVVAGAQGNALATVALGKAEDQLGLQEMRDGEKLARDLYDKYAK